MASPNRSLLKIPAIVVLGTCLCLGSLYSAPPQIPLRRGPLGPAPSATRVVNVASQPFFPTFGGFNGFYSPFNGASYSPAPYLPNYWWTGYYPEADSCQAGCNPDAGYSWDSVVALILSTEPKNAKVTLDGVFVGTTDRLGPFQLPVGEHTLRIEAEGYEPSEKVLNVESPHVEQLEIRLNPSPAFSPKPAPKL
jgi:PEGA domain-containing protein